MKQQAPYILRQLTEADVFSVIDSERLIFPNDTWSEAMITEELSRPDRLYLGGVETSGQMRLFAYAGIRIGVDADLMTLGVLPSWRGRGVGSTLLAEIVDLASRIRFEHPNRWVLEVATRKQPGASAPRGSEGIDGQPKLEPFIAPVEDPVLVPWEAENENPGPLRAPDGTIARPRRRIERIILEVRASNLAAQSLYRTHGFTRIARIKDYYRNPGEDALVMQRDLP